MRLRISLLRIKGYRRAHREVANGPCYVGELLMTQVWVSKTETRKAAVLSTGGGRPELIVPELFEPILTAIGAGGFILRGYERIDLGDGPLLVVQEWDCSELSRSDGRYDRDWHPAIAKMLRKRDGVTPTRDPRT